MVVQKRFKKRKSSGAGRLLVALVIGYGACVYLAHTGII